MKDIQALHGVQVLNAMEPWHADGTSTDTRKPVDNTLFVALRGEHYDGHDFLRDAVSRGAAGVVVKQGTPYPLRDTARTVPVFVTEDTVAFLGDLAHALRQRYRPTVITITGSNGKTTTKELIAGLLSGTYATGRTEGNLNNRIGLPLSMLNMDPGARVWVLELGTSRYGELDALTRIAAPDIGVLTTIGRAHLEFFHDLRGVARAKSEMFTAMDPGGVAIMNADDPLVMDIAGRFGGTVLTAGFSEHAQLRVRSFALQPAGMDFIVAFEGVEHHLRTQMTGRHYLLDLALAIRCALHLNVGWDAIGEACARFTPFKGRGTILTYATNVTIIDDTYNANPDSMRSGFMSAAQRYGASNIVAVIGDMLELGAETERQHAELGQFLVNEGIRTFILIGTYADRTLQGIRASGVRQVYTYRTDDLQSAAQELVSLSKPGTAIYVKGSRSMKLEQLIAAYDTRMRGRHA